MHTNTLNLFRNTQDQSNPKWIIISSYPTRQCGIATYSFDLIQAIEQHFEGGFDIEVAALETATDYHHYTDEHVTYLIRTDYSPSYQQFIDAVKADESVDGIVIQHEFGLFRGNETDLLLLMEEVQVPIVLNFHTVLPNPGEYHLSHVRALSERAKKIIVMTEHAKSILITQYGIDEEKLTIIPHGTHRVNAANRTEAKAALHLENRLVLSTFGLISEGKSIETTLRALPQIIRTSPNVLFLIIGKTHPTVVLNSGETYREQLQQLISDLGLEAHVRFVNHYLDLDELLAYLLATDLYLFTSKDRNQAVSGTFVYALSAGCTVLCTPIPHAQQFIHKGAVLPFEFENETALAEAVNRVVFDVELREAIQANASHYIVDSAWDNVAIRWANELKSNSAKNWNLTYRIPPINVQHLQKLTTDFGMLQFSKYDVPDVQSGYTLDDNARALIVAVDLYNSNPTPVNAAYLDRYLQFIRYCQQPNHWFMNYVDLNHNYTLQNKACNLQDATGRAIWALGYVLASKDRLPKPIVQQAEQIMQTNWHLMLAMDSPRAIAFSLKGLRYYYTFDASEQAQEFATILADRLCQLYKANADTDWHWFESYMTYANSVLPEAVLCAYQITLQPNYLAIAKSSFDFLRTILFPKETIKVISNKTWYHRGLAPHTYGEQPIDVAYCILALKRFFDETGQAVYIEQAKKAFVWFLGHNHLNQVIYNSTTGGCYDGLEMDHVNLNQGAESTLCYFLAREAVYSHFKQSKKSPETSPNSEWMVNKKMTYKEKSRY